MEQQEQTFLPITRGEIAARGWEQPDLIMISGDAYVDHPSFGVAIISRLLEAYGFKVAVLAQPDWKNPGQFSLLGEPRLGFLISAGNVDSMVSHYSVAKKLRRADAYSPGGKTGLRPDRALSIYARKVREVYPQSAIILGGIEASLRRMAHYDYWTDRVQPSVLLDAGADLLIYGMGERPVIEVAEALASGIKISDITYVRGTVVCVSELPDPAGTLMLPSFDQVKNSQQKFAESFMAQYKNSEPQWAKALAEPYPGCYLLQNPPAEQLTQDELDQVYRLPYIRNYHPIYEKAGGVPALSEVKFSLVSSRGCFGGCSFCALHFHQGRTVQARSIEAVVEEAEKLTSDPDFKGYIHDVGGPTANFRQKACEKQLKYGTCVDKSCLFPKPCKNLIVDHRDYLELLRRLRSLAGVKKVFIRSGIRHDYLLCDPDPLFFEELCAHHISGQLKVAPEHVAPKVLEKMGKPGREIYLAFKKSYKQINRKLGKEQYLVPYFMSSHPGSDLEAAVELASFIRKHEHLPEQVQDFYPTPGTLSTCMYYTGLDPRTMEPVYVPKNPHEKAMQRALIQFRNPKLYRLVFEALVKVGRKDLIGYGRNCLIKPPGSKKNKITGPVEERDQGRAKRKTKQKKKKESGRKNLEI
jgi:uncharacterized radical SAM protein YgiQ